MVLVCIFVTHYGIDTQIWIVIFAMYSFIQEAELPPYDRVPILLEIQNVHVKRFNSPCV